MKKVAFYVALLIAWLAFVTFVWPSMSPAAQLAAVIAVIVVVALRWRSLPVGLAAAGAASAVLLVLMRAEQALPQLPPQEQISGFFNMDALRVKIFHEGGVPLTIVWVAVFGFVALLLTARDILARLAIADVQLKLYEQGKVPLEEVTYYGDIMIRLKAHFRENQDLGAVLALKDELLSREEEKAVLAFEPVRWSEWTLPMLGFLGTVIGIGDAITLVSRGVFTLLEGRGQAVTGAGLESFNRGFAGMALAFDTTFLGLAGLIALGSMRSWTRKFIAGSLSTGRQRIGDWVAVTFKRSKESGAPFVVLQAAVDSLALAIESEAAEAKSVRDKVLTTVERVVMEDPHCASIRDVLMKTVVALERGSAELRDNTIEHLDRRLGTENWMFTAVATSAVTSECAAIVRVSDPTSDHIYWFRPDGARDGDVYQAPNRLLKLWILGDGDVVALTEDEGALVRLSRSDGSLELTTTTLVESLSVTDQVIAIGSSQAQERLLLARWDAVTLVVSDLIETAGDGEPIYREYGHELRAWCHRRNSLFMLIKRGMNDLVVEWLDPSAQPRDVKGRPRDTGQQRGQMALPRDQDPKSIVPLSASAVVLVGGDGRPSYWDTSLTVSPVKLHHDDWPNGAVVVAGLDGWLAVMANHELKMWRVGRGGFLVPYRSNGQAVGLPIGGADASKFVVSADGAWLIGVDGTGLLTYRFPSYVMDAI